MSLENFKKLDLYHLNLVFFFQIVGYSSAGSFMLFSHLGLLGLLYLLDVLGLLSFFVFLILSEKLQRHQINLTP